MVLAEAGEVVRAVAEDSGAGERVRADRVTDTEDAAVVVARNSHYDAGTRGPPLLSTSPRVVGHVDILRRQFPTCDQAEVGRTRGDGLREHRGGRQEAVYSPGQESSVSVLDWRSFRRPWTDARLTLSPTVYRGGQTRRRHTKRGRTEMQKALPLFGWDTEPMLGREKAIR